MLNINWSNNIHSVFNLDMDKHKGIFMAGSGGVYLEGMKLWKNS